MNMKNLMTGVLVGVAVGTGLALLLKSEKCAAIRRKLTRPRVAYTDELEEKFEILIDKVTEEFNNLVLEVNQMALGQKPKV
jgi:gas vesicle protein